MSEHVGFASVQKPESPRWMRRWMLAAAIYNFAWGTWVALFPMSLFDLLAIDRPVYPQIWQCVGMIVGVYGVGYWIAARNPIHWWPIVLVGFLGKVLGPIGFAWAIAFEGFPVAFGWTILTNDLVWWTPFGLILYHARHEIIAHCRGSRLMTGGEDA